MLEIGTNTDNTDKHINQTLEELEKSKLKENIALKLNKELEESLEERDGKITDYEQKLNQMNKAIEEKENICRILRETNKKYEDDKKVECSKIEELIEQNKENIDKYEEEVYNLKDKSDNIYKNENKEEMIKMSTIDSNEITNNIGILEIQPPTRQEIGLEAKISTQHQGIQAVERNQTLIFSSHVFKLDYPNKISKIVDFGINTDIMSANIDQLLNLVQKLNGMEAEYKQKLEIQENQNEILRREKIQMEKNWTIANTQLIRRNNLFQDNIQENVTNLNINLGKLGEKKEVEREIDSEHVQLVLIERLKKENDEIKEIKDSLELKLTEIDIYKEQNIYTDRIVQNIEIERDINGIDIHEEVIKVDWEIMTDLTILDLDSQNTEYRQMKADLDKLGEEITINKTKIESISEIKGEKSNLEEKLGKKRNKLKILKEDQINLENKFVVYQEEIVMEKENLNNKITNQEEKLAELRIQSEDIKKSEGLKRDKVTVIINISEININWPRIIPQQSIEEEEEKRLLIYELRNENEELKLREANLEKEISSILAENEQS